MSRSRELSEYIASVASDTPTPGGGSVAGIMGALGCSLGEMAAGISIKKASPSDMEILVDSRNQLSTLRQKLEALAIADEAAYSGYRQAMAMPRSTDDEKSIRSATLAESLGIAAGVPADIAKTSCQAIELLIPIATVGSRNLTSDILTALYALSASTKGALTHVRVNAELIKIAQERNALLETIRSIEMDLGSASTKLETAVTHRSTQ